MKKIMAIILALVLCIMCFAGCQKKEETSLQRQGENLVCKITDEPLKLTYFAKKVDAYENNVFTEAFEMTNVLLEPTLSENVTNMDEALSLAVASRELPDVIYDYSPLNFNKYGSSGALIPLNDLIDKYAPNYKKFLDENPEVRYYSTASDGNIYFIPFVADGDASTAWFVRQDWLDKLGLEQPATIEEFYNVMVAFRDNDPNGNGKKDEVPFFSSKGDVDSLLSLFNTGTGFSYDGNTATFEPMEDRFLEAVTEISKWYDEKLIDEEWFVRTDAREYFTINNTGGITHNWIGSTAGINNNLKDKIEGFNFIPFAPPAGPDGVRREQNRRNLLGGEGWAISASNKYPEETMKYFDFWWSEEGRRLANFGIEGTQYELVDGKPVFKDEVLNGEQAISVVMLDLRAKTNFGFRQDFEYEKQWLNQIARDGMKLYTEGGFLPEKVQKPALFYSDDEKRQSILKTQIETYLYECLQNWILGNSDPEADFDDFKKNLKKLEIDEYIEIEQKAYDNYLNSIK